MALTLRGVKICVTQFIDLAPKATKMTDTDTRKKTHRTGYETYFRTFCCNFVTRVDTPTISTCQIWNYKVCGTSTIEV